MTVSEALMTEPTASKVIALRKLDAQTALLQHALCQVIDPVNITAGNAQLLVGLDAPRAPQGDVPWLHFTLDGAKGAIQLPWGIVRRLTGLSAEVAIPEDAALVLEASMEAALDQAETMCGFVLRFVALEKTADDLPVSSTLNLQGKDASGSFVQMRQAVALSAQAAATLAELLTSRRARRPDLPGLALSLAWEEDAILLPGSALRALVPGDAIELSADQMQGRVVLHGQYFAAAKRDGAQVTLTSDFAPLFQDEETDMPQDAAAENAPEDIAAPVDVDDIEVRLSFRAGQTSVPLKTLRGLAPGAVIEMSDPANAVVDIVANGRVVGAGELIDVAGRRAVQIRRIFSGL